MLKSSRNIDLAQETVQGFLGNSDFGEQSFDGNGPTGFLIAAKHDAAHTAAAQHLNHVVTGHGLRVTAQLRATVFAEESHTFVWSGCLGLLSSAAVQTLNGDYCGACGLVLPGAFCDGCF